MRTGVNIIREWNLVKIMTYADQLSEITYAPGKTIYTVGEPSENVFIVKRGTIQLEVFFLVKTIIDLPVSYDGYTQKTVSRVIARTVRTIGRGEQFGFEEFMKLYKSRVIRAKVVGSGPAVCLYAKRERFFEYVKDKDLLMYLHTSQAYTDFDKEGRD